MAWFAEKKITVQDTIPYQEMARDGICKVRDRTYSKTVQFYDINYQLAQDEDKNAIFEGWCDFLNYFDPSIHFQFSFLNQKSNMREYRDIIKIPLREDGLDDYRIEYSGMLQRQLAHGNNGLVKRKYLTFSIEAENIAKARPRLERIETDILNNFKMLGVIANPLSGKERLKILYEIFHPDEQLQFRFDYDDMVTSGLTTKDYIAPASFVFKSGKDFCMGDTFGECSYLQLLSPEISDDLLKKFLDTEHSQVVNFHIQSIDQLKAIKMVKAKMTDIHRMVIEEQKRAVRSGYDMDILPSDLVTYSKTAQQILDDLQSRNERLFHVTILFMHTAKTKKQLKSAVFQSSGIAQEANCALRRLDFLQEQGMMSSLPLGVNYVPVSRDLTTTAAAIFIPFTTQELFMGGDSLYYGINAQSHNMIMVDRKRLKNPNGLYLGKPGSGKSFAAKREIIHAYFTTGDDFYICDPEAEYAPLVEALHGQVVVISPSSKNFINPMDINLDYADDDNPLGFKSEFLLSLIELIMNRHNGIEPEERSVIDRCLPIVYQGYFADPRPENMPTLEDLYLCLRKQKEEEAQHIATALEIYVNGTLNVFNHQTNVELDNRIVCFDIKDLGKQLKKIGMLIVQDQVWNRVTVNRYKRISTRYYLDEMHLLLKEPQTANHTIEVFKRFRKWGGIPTGLTQNAKELNRGGEIDSILENCDFLYILNQGHSDGQLLAKMLNISKYQLSYVTNSPEGCGLMFYGNIIIPFQDQFDKKSRLYQLMTTKPEEMKFYD